MSLLHSFYCWGQVTVVLLTTTMIKVFGDDLWCVAPIIWSFIPLINTVNFIGVPIKPNLTSEEKIQEEPEIELEEELINLI